MTIHSRRDPAFVQRYGPWALITGGSDGLGAEFARQAASRGLNCLLVARTASKLDALAEQLKKDFGVETRTRTVNLTAETAMQDLTSAALGVDIGLIIFNAGGDTAVTRFLETPVEVWRELTRRNIDLLTEACHHFGGAMVKRGRGGVLIVGSEAALGGQGRLSIYTATKGYAINFGESLWQEWRSNGVDVLNAIIGATDTPHLRRVLASHGLPLEAVKLADPRDIARVMLEGLGHGPTLFYGEDEASTELPKSARRRRDRVVELTKLLDKFYGSD
jgi:short-subunit dehydrogenase